MPFFSHEIEYPGNFDIASTETFISVFFYSNVSQSIQKAKRRMEDKFKFVLKKGKKKDGNVEESGGGCELLTSEAHIVSFRIFSCRFQ